MFFAVFGAERNGFSKSRLQIVADRKGIRQQILRKMKILHVINSLSTGGAEKYKMRYFYEKVYVCEYLQDGLTASSVRQRRNSPATSLLCYSEFYRIPNLPVSRKIKGMINFWRFAFCSKRGFFSKLKQGGVLSLIGFIPGFLMFLRDGRAVKQK